MYTSHHALFYRGRFDAIVELNGIPTLVDWKTAKAGEIKSVEEDTALSSLYTNPVQIAAYIGAVNADPRFEHIPTIRQGAVVRAFVDGQPADVVIMNEDTIEEYYKQFLNRLNYFWWQLKNKSPTASGYISFVFNPVRLEESFSKRPQLAGA
jgi:genome maintenance exonuclease 1